MASDSSSQLDPNSSLLSRSVLLATAGYDHSIRLWEPHTGKCQRNLPHPDSHVNSLAFTPDRVKLAAGAHQAVRIFDIESSNSSPLVRYEGFHKNVMCLGFCEDGRWMFTGGEDGNARIWDLRIAATSELQCQRVYKIGTSINCVFLHPNQAELVLGDQLGTVHLWDLNTDSVEKIIPDPTPSDRYNKSIQGTCVDMDAVYLACVDTRGHCYVWSLNQQSEKEKVTPRKDFRAHLGYALKCLFSPDSSLLATTASSGEIKLWSTVNFMIKSELETKGQRWVWDCAFTRDSQYIVTASSDGTARLWDTEQGKLKREYAGHDKAIVCLAFNDNV